jgi:hypothetical protein
VAEETQRKGAPKLWWTAGRWVRVLLVLSVAVGLAAALYHVFDIVLPAGPVGDMQWVVIMVRAVAVGAGAIPLLVGCVLLWLSGRRTSRWPLIIAVVLIVPFAALQVAMGVIVANVRQAEAVRQTYEGKTVAELVKTARESADEYAVYALMQKRRGEPRQALRELLKDRHLAPELRCAAARCIGQIGEPADRELLTEVRNDATDARLLQAIDDARFYLEMRFGGESGVAGAGD